MNLESMLEEIKLREKLISDKTLREFRAYQIGLFLSMYHHGHLEDIPDSDYWTTKQELKYLRRLCK